MSLRSRIFAGEAISQIAGV